MRCWEKFSLVSGSEFLFSSEKQCFSGATLKLAGMEFNMMVINAPRFTVYQRQRAPLLRACPVLHSAGSGSKSLSHVRDFTLKRSFYIYRFIWLSSYCWVQLQRVIHEISTSQHTQIMSDGVGNVASDCHRMTVSFVQVCLQSLLSIP